MDECPICGFVFASLTVEHFRSAIADGAARCAAALAATDPGVVAMRTHPDEWSVLEYAAHVRDVLFVTRDRIILTLVEENPSFAKIYRDERVSLGIYDGESPETVAAEIAVGARMLDKTLSVITDAQFARPCVYNYPGPSQRSVGFVVQNTVHELRHHLGDMVAVGGLA